MINKSDFTFIEKEPTGWCWYSIRGESKKTVSETIHEQGFITVTEVGYNTNSGELCVAKQFLCDCQYTLYENDELLDVVKELINE